MTTFHLATVVLPQPVTVYLPPGGMRPRVVAPGGDGSAPITSENGVETVLEKLECAFAINVVTQTIHAQIARIPRPLMIYGPVDFAAVAADLPEHHGERVLQVLGSDPAAVLQALADGTELPPRPPRVPRSIRAWQGRAVLREMGLLDNVQALVDQLNDPAVTEAWDARENLARRGRTVLGMAAALGLSEAQVDALFIAADALEV